MILRSDGNLYSGRQKLAERQMITHEYTMNSISREKSGVECNYIYMSFYCYEKIKFILYVAIPSENVC